MCFSTFWLVENFHSILDETKKQKKKNKKNKTKQNKKKQQQKNVWCALLVVKLNPRGITSPQSKE